MSAWVAGVAHERSAMSEDTRRVKTCIQEGCLRGRALAWRHRDVFAP